MARATLASVGYESSRVTILLGPGQREVVRTLAERHGTTPSVVVGCVARYFLLAGALTDDALAAYIDGWISPSGTIAQDKARNGDGYMQLEFGEGDESRPL